MHPVLLDRMMVVKMPDLTPDDRMSIVSTHILPRLGKMDPIALSRVQEAVADTKLGEGMRGIEKMLERAALHASIRTVRKNENHKATDVMMIDKNDVDMAIKQERQQYTTRTDHMSMYS